MSEATQRPDPSVMKGVIPYIGFRGQAGAAADFYGRAFGATELGRLENPESPGQYMHLQIEINGGCLMMTDHTDTPDDTPALGGMHLQLVVHDGPAWWERAVAAGCAVVMPYERQPWGDDWGMVKDPFGLLWAVLEPGEPQG